MKRILAITSGEEDSRTESSVDDSSSLSDPTCPKRSKKEVYLLDAKEVHPKKEDMIDGIRDQLSAGDAIAPQDKPDFEQPSISPGKYQSRSDNSSPERCSLGQNQSIPTAIEERKKKKKRKNMRKADALRANISSGRSSSSEDEKAVATTHPKQEVKIEKEDFPSGQVDTQPVIIPQSQTAGPVISSKTSQYGQPPLSILSEVPSNSDISEAPNFGTKCKNLDVEESMKLFGLPLSFGKPAKVGVKSRAESSSSERGPLGSNSIVQSMGLARASKVRDGEEDEETTDGDCCADESGVRDSRFDSIKYKEVAAHTEEYIDSHCHIDFINDKNHRSAFTTLESLRKEFNSAFPSTFKGCIANFIRPPYTNWNWIKNIMKDNQVLGSSWGVHPHHSGAATIESLEELKKKIMDNREILKIVAIGECGIDLSGRNDVPLEKQTEVFKFQVNMAYELDLPIIIHCREGKGKENDPEDYILDILKERPNHPIHRHCFTRDINVARRWMRTLNNCTFGFTPMVCYSDWFVDLITKIPLDRVHLETDAPYFIPTEYAVFNRLRYSLPGAAIVVAIRISEILQLPLDEVIRVTRMCTNRIYRLPRYL